MVPGLELNTGSSSPVYIFPISPFQSIFNNLAFVVPLMMHFAVQIQDDDYQQTS